MGVSFLSSPTVTAWLASIGVRHFETQEPADLEYDAQLRVVAEWRERSTLFKAHVHDAVTDVMLEAATPGAALRVERYRAEHRAIGERLLGRAESFQRERGYPPPFWELVRLAREASRRKQKE